MLTILQQTASQSSSGGDNSSLAVIVAAILAAIGLSPYLGRIWGAVASAIEGVAANVNSRAKERAVSNDALQKQMDQNAALFARLESRDQLWLDNANLLSKTQQQLLHQHEQHEADRQRWEADRLKWEGRMNELMTENKVIPQLEQENAKLKRRVERLTQRNRQLATLLGIAPDDLDTLDADDSTTLAPLPAHVPPTPAPAQDASSSAAAP